MGFARFLNNKPLNLSGIKQFTPDLNQAEKTLDSITTDYDEVQALSNAIPEYLQGDSEAMRAKQDEYRASIQKATDAYATQGTGAGNSILRNIKSTIQSDFSTTGEVFGMGNNFKEAEKTKAALKEAGVSGEMYTDYLENNLPTSSYDEDGNFARYEAPGSLPTVPNYSERALKYGKASLPTITELDTVITDEAGNITGIQKYGEKKRTMDELVTNISKLMEGDNDIVESQNVYGDAAVRQKRKAIEGAVRSYYQFDTKTTISNLGKTGGSSPKKKNKPVTDVTTFMDGDKITITGGPKLVRNEQLSETGEILENSEVYDNIEKNLIENTDVDASLLKIAGKNNADQTITNTFVESHGLPNGDNPYEITKILPSDDYGVDGAKREEGIFNYTFGKLLQEGGSDNKFFLKENERPTFEGKNTVEEYKKNLAKKRGISMDELNAEITEAGERIYDELEITKDFDKMVAKADAVIQGRNGLINAKKYIDKEVREESMKQFTDLGRRYLDGDFENMTTIEKMALAKELAIDTTNFLPSDDSKTQVLNRAQAIEDGANAKLEKLQARKDKLNAELVAAESKEPRNEFLINRIQNNLSLSEKMITNTDNRLKETFKRANRIRKKVAEKEAELEAEKASKTPDKTKIKILETFLNDDNASIIEMEKQIKKSIEGKYEDTKEKKQEEILENMYANKNYDISTFTSLLRNGKGIPNLQDPPARNSKLNNLQETEHYYAAGIGATGSGLGIQRALDINGLEITKNDSAEPLSPEEMESVIGVSYRATGVDAQGNYIMTGYLQKVEGKGTKATIVTTDIGVVVNNKNYNTAFQKLSHSGNPTAIKPHTDNLLNAFAVSEKNSIVDDGFIGDMYAIQIRKGADNRPYFTIHDQIGKGDDKVGKEVYSKRYFTDSFDLAQQLTELRTEVLSNGTTRKLGPAGTYDKELKVKNLANYEDGFGQATNIKFSPTESIERKALDKEFGNQFIEVFGNFKSDVIVTSMLRSLNNQKKLNADYGINKKQLTSGHLLGEGIDVAATPDLISEFATQFGGLEKFNAAFKNKDGTYKKKRVEFKGMSVYIHGNDKQGTHLDIKKINK